VTADRPVASHRPARLVVPLASAIGIAFGAVLYGFSVLITTEAAGGVFSASLLSSAFGGSVLVSGAAAVPVGRWVDRAGIRPVLATGACLVGIGFVGFAFAREPWQVLATWWVLIGPGAAMALFDPAFVAIQRWFTPSVRNRAAGTLTLVTGLAGPIFVPATTAGVGAIGWRATAGALGGLVALAGLTATVLLRSAPWSSATPDEAAPSATSGHPARDRARWTWRFVALTAAMALLFAVLEAVQVHRIARFEAIGFAPGVVATWAAIASLASLPGRFLVPRLADRFDPARVMATLLILLIPAVALTIRGTHDAEMVGHFVLFGLLFGATIPMRAVLMGDRFAGPSFGALMGVQAAAIAVGRSAGPASVGWLRDATSAYGTAMTVLTVTTVVCLVLLVAATGSRGPRSLRSAPGADEETP
jgi:MFS family permease